MIKLLKPRNLRPLFRGHLQLPHRILPTTQHRLDRDLQLLPVGIVRDLRRLEHEAGHVPPTQIARDLFVDGGFDFRVRSERAGARGGAAFDEEEHAFRGVGIGRRDALLADDEAVNDGGVEAWGGEDSVDFGTAEADPGRVEDAVAVGFYECVSSIGGCRGERRGKKVEGNGKWEMCCTFFRGRICPWFRG